MLPGQRPLRGEGLPNPAMAKTSSKNGVLVYPQTETPSYGGRTLAPAGNNWRNASEYDYFDDLTSEQVAFEFLRRNPEYDVAYNEHRNEPTGTSSSRSALFAAHWGLRFRGRSAAPQRPGADHLAAPAQSKIGGADPR